MNSSLIEWCDRSWNPITGCMYGCTYCYAAKQARRFCGDIRLNKASKQLKHLSNGLYELDNPFKNIGGRTIPLPVGFEPTLHGYRLSQPAMVTKKSLNIFVGSMADIFGEWVPERWIEKTFDACAAAPWHQYMFLTKNPSRFMELYKKGILPEGKNFWYGTTVNRTADFTRASKAEALQNFGHESTFNTFLSIEPLLSELEDVALMNLHHFQWVIVGAISGYGSEKYSPQREWVDSIMEYCRKDKIPLFEKDSLAKIVNRHLICEFPIGLQPRPASRPLHRVHVESVRDKKCCNECGVCIQGKSAVRLGARRYECISCFDKLESESW